MDINGNYIQNQFCSYEIALALKEIGFDEPCFGFWDKYTLDTEVELKVEIQHRTNAYFIEANAKNCCLAPLYQQVWSFLDDNGVIIGIIFVDNVFKYTLNIENYVSDEFKDRMSVIKSATEYATNYLWNKKFNK